jgi:hypothetical protein
MATLGQIVQVVLSNYERRIAIVTAVKQDGSVIDCAVFTSQYDPFPSTSNFPLWAWSNVTYAADSDNEIGTWHNLPVA